MGNEAQSWCGGKNLVKFIDPAGRALRSDSFSSLCYFYCTLSRQALRVIAVHMSLKKFKLMSIKGR